MGDMHRTAARPAERDPRTSEPGSRPGGTAAGGAFKPSVQARALLQRRLQVTTTTSRLAWDNAKDAVRAAWHRVERLMPGDFDNDGR